MNILLIGSGGREHALAWKIKQSPRCSTLFIAPGNPGTAQVGKNVPIAVDDFPTLADFCVQQKIELLVIGPEVPLVQGLRDYFERDARLAAIGIVGPGKVGAQLEGSKDFSKQFMVRHGIPTASAKTFQGHELDAALSYVEGIAPPIVVKADGLAAGKGVIIAQSVAEAKASLTEMLAEKKFGEAGAKVLIEKFLSGIEVSVFVLTDGQHYVLLPEAKDYKRIGNNDKGLNTGGMGAVSPVAFCTRAFMQKVITNIIEPTIAGLAKENIPYKGFIFFGLINVGGEPFVIEYNARMGDPETQAVLTRLDGDLVELLHATAHGTLHGKSTQFFDKQAVTVCMVSGGYPEKFSKGHIISGLSHPSEALTFHAGTKEADGQLVNDGGRVLAITGLGATIPEARANAYARVSQLNWEGVYFRSDIGNDLISMN